jgi:hypothetical protein
VTPLEKYGGYGFGIVLGLALVIFSKTLGYAFGQLQQRLSADPGTSQPREDRPERIQRWREEQGSWAAFWRFGFLFMGTSTAVFCLLALVGLLD